MNSLDRIDLPPEALSRLVLGTTLEGVLDLWFWYTPGEAIRVSFNTFVVSQSADSHLVHVAFYMADVYQSHAATWFTHEQLTAFEAAAAKLKGASPPRANL